MPPFVQRTIQRALRGSMLPRILARLKPEDDSKMRFYRYRGGWEEPDLRNLRGNLR